MVLNIQSNRVQFPVDELGQTPDSPNIFVAENGITPQSAAYNQGQLTDALIKVSQGREEELSDRFRGPMSKKEAAMGDLKANKTRGWDNTRVPLYLGAEQAVTEREAFDYYKTMQNDKSGVWADPSNYGNLSIVELDAMRQDDLKNGTTLVQDGMDRYRKYLNGRTQTPDQPLDFRPGTETREPGIERTMKNIARFREVSDLAGYGDLLLPRARPGKELKTKKSVEKSKNKILSQESANGLTDMTNDLERAINPSIRKESDEDTFLDEQSNLNDPMNPGKRARKTNWEVIEESYGITRKNKEFFASTVVGGMVGIIDHLRMIKSDKQALSAFLTLPEATFQEEMEAEALLEDELDKSIDEQLEETGDIKGVDKRREASIDNLKRGFNVRNEQPILNSTVHMLDSFIRDHLAPGTKGSNTMEAPGSLLRYFTERGYIYWGRTKGGYIVPVIKENLGVKNISQTELATAYNPSLRQKKYSAVNASTFPVLDDFNVNDRGDWKKFLKVSKDMTGRSSISKALLSMLKTTAISIDEEQLAILAQILSQVLEDIEKNGIAGGSKHPFAKLIGELDNTAHSLYSARDRKAKADPHQDIIERKNADDLVHQHAVTATNKVSEIIQKLKEQKAGGLKYFLQWYKSGPTGRYFVMDTLFNHINDKGLIRTVLNVGKKVPIDITGKEFRDLRVIKEISDKLYNPGGKGLAKWEKINASLHKLPASQRQLMGFLYSMGKTAHDFGIKESLISLENPAAAIEHGINSFDLMADRGINYRTWIAPEKGKIDPLEMDRWEKVQPDEGEPGHVPGKPSWKYKTPKMPAYQELDAIDKKIFKKKGEWQYPLSIAMDASKLKEALANEDKTFAFNFKIEQDARQSNAAMQSLITGDGGIAGVLGTVKDLARRKLNSDGETVSADDLRDLLLSNISETVRLTLNNDDSKDRDRHDAVAQYFTNSARDFGSKTVVGGLIVAGLYGKWPGYMYDEVETMLGKTGAGLYGVNHTQELLNAYEGDLDVLIRDISQVYLQLSQEHMSGLMGYQHLMKSVGSVMGAFDGPTEIDGLYVGENITLAIDELHNTTSEQVVGDELQRAGTEMAGWFYPAFRKGREAISASPTVADQRARKSRTDELERVNKAWKEGENIPGQPSFAERKQQIEESAMQLEEALISQGLPPEQAKDEADKMRDEEPTLDPRSIPSLMRGEEGTEHYKVLGSQVSRALPVVAIQNMDSLALGLAWMIANGNNLSPPSATAIHDAIISTADSVLLLNNAYNNIVPNVFARGGKAFLSRVIDTMNRDVVNPILRAPDDARFNIGTEVAYSDVEPYTTSLEPKKDMSKLRNLSGVTSYYDEIYNRYVSKDEFLSPEQLDREKIFGKRKSGISNRKWGEYKKKMDGLTIRAAINNGYRPPGEGGRKNYSVSGKQMKRLLVLMLEREGLLSEDKRNLLKKKKYNLYNIMGVDPRESVPGFDEDSKIIDGAVYKMEKTIKGYNKNRKKLIEKLSEQTNYNNNLE